MPEDCPHCAALREEVAYLRGELGLEVEQERLEDFRRALGLFPTAARLLLLMHARRGRIVNKAFFHDQVHGERAEQGKSLEVYVWQVRHALGAEIIETVWGQGYRLTDVGRAKVEAALA